MIDLHTHIIPGVDDGSRSFTESLNMLKIAEEDGIQTMAATPHIFSSAGKITELEQFRQIFSDFRDRVVNSGSSIEIVQGGEVFFTTNLREKMKEFRDILTINGSDYFLLEFPPGFIFPGSDKFIFNILNDGFIPVICHPERNIRIQQDPGILYKFLMTGALSQLDAGSLRGDFGSDASETAYKLLKFNMVHLIASDCHNENSRISGLSFVYEKLQGFEKEKIDIYIKDVPEAIVRNRAVPDIGTIKNPGEKRSIFQIFRR